MGPGALWSEIRERHGPGAGQRRVEIVFRRGSLSLRQEIQTDGGFEFKLPSDLLNQTLNPDCEQSWYLQSHFSRGIMFRVRNQTAVTPNSDVVNEASLQHSVQLNLIDVI
ncbi:hypothetical protein ROHU_004735 [Labeo rohita]|uniref:Uncharacterized protein n=1 Tax=Labeo rohita TaxID=84645 RepID=A0A498NJA7_LABRO|nr:hypothetical protein ROHU_004735 [Labeo rohita]